ncbi:uracil-xanthine permease family protein [Rhodococcus sp. IEGM 1318]|uniref:uracil-xanthine permease family protein n=1 Tax=Rhodococcus sp. IEGM 1318 TaxID=3082226 RepID=UPI002953704E|nr:solute carrier family 23 protein [Rhodococcus sp. IEGM 1318]MDV8006031.1 solute carrier family 23 protein [Rhodococcus sp. IEGM 1318]
MPIWTLHGDGKNIGPGEVVAPGERLSWARTIGLGGQHVVSMFGATFVFPIIMGLNPQLAVMMSGFCTLFFLLVVKGHVPSYLGTSAAFVGGVAAIRAQGGTTAEVTGAILVSGLVLGFVGIAIHFLGGGVIGKALPPVVTGAVVMLIGFNLAPVVAGLYWPQDQWVALIVMVVLIVMSVALRGFLGRIAILVALVFGYIFSWVLDRVSGPITSASGSGAPTEHFRVNWDSVHSASWFGLPPFSDEANGIVGIHAPSFSLTFIVLVLPGVIALVAENAGHVKAVAEITGDDLDPYIGRAIAGDGFATAIASAVGGSPTTTHAENIGVMAATRVYSTAAYVIAGFIAILLGFSPKFGAVMAATPGGVLGGILVVLFGMIGLLGAKIWKENGVDFGNPLNLMPIAAGLIIGIGDTALKFSDTFSLGGIALGTIVVIVMYHLCQFVGSWNPELNRPKSGRQPSATPGANASDDEREVPVAQLT